MAVSKTVLNGPGARSGGGEVGEGPGPRRAGPVRIVQLMTNSRHPRAPEGHGRIGS